mgnify:CR=1 FL=1
MSSPFGRYRTVCVGQGLRTLYRERRRLSILSRELVLARSVDTYLVNGWEERMELLLRPDFLKNTVKKYAEAFREEDELETKQNFGII